MVATGETRRTTAKHRTRKKAADHNLSTAGANNNGNSSGGTAARVEDSEISRSPVGAGADSAGGQEKSLSVAPKAALKVGGWVEIIGGYSGQYNGKVAKVLRLDKKRHALEVDLGSSTAWFEMRYVRAIDSIEAAQIRAKAEPEVESADLAKLIEPETDPLTELLLELAEDLEGKLDPKKVEAQILESGSTAESKDADHLKSHWALIFNPRRHPYRLPDFEKVRILRETPHTIRVTDGDRQWNQPKHKAWCLPTQASWQEFRDFYANYQGALDDLATKLRGMDRYDRLLKRNPKGANPLTPTAIEICDPDYHHAWNTEDWRSPYAFRLELEKHTPVMLRTLKNGKPWGMQAQALYFACPDDETWECVEALTVRAKACADTLTDYLNLIGAYAQATKKGEDWTEELSNITPDNKPPTIIENQAKSIIAAIAPSAPTHELNSLTTSLHLGDRIRAQSLNAEEEGQVEEVEGVVTYVGNKYGLCEDDTGRTRGIVLEGVQREFPFDFYPDFLTSEEADRLLEQSEAMQWSHNEFQIFGKNFLLPRLEAMYGNSECSYTYRNVTLEPLPWNEPLQQLREKVEQKTGYAYQVTIGNFYRSGSDHIGWHSDDSPEMGESPAIASISLGATRKFSLRNKSTKEVHDFELTHGSLLVMHPGCQTDYVHRIAKTSKESGKRINWTFRPHVGAIAPATAIVVAHTHELREPLATLASQIRTAYEECEQALNIAKQAHQSAVEHAKHCGQLLLQAKTQVRHGDWKSWLEENCPEISERTDRYYRQLAENWTEEIAQAETLRKAISLLPKRQSKTATVAVLPSAEDKPPLPAVGTTLIKDGAMAEVVSHDGALAVINARDGNTIVSSRLTAREIEQECQPVATAPINAQQKTSAKQMGVGHLRAIAQEQAASTCKRLDALKKHLPDDVDLTNVTNAVEEAIMQVLKKLLEKQL